MWPIKLGRILSLGSLRPRSKSGIPEVPNRILRNWLTSLVKKGAIEAQGERNGRRDRLRPGPIVGTEVWRLARKLD